MFHVTFKSEHKLKVDNLANTLTSEAFRHAVIY